MSSPFVPSDVEGLAPGPCLDFARHERVAD